MRFRNILTVVQNFGEYDKLLGGVLENYLNVRYRDSYLQSVRLRLNLNWTLMSHLQPYKFKSFHFDLKGYRRFGVDHMV